jgi:hypothetical protein
MKTTFKRIITAIAATAMCAVPMVNAMTASADGPVKRAKSELEIKVEEQAQRAWLQELRGLKLSDRERVKIVGGKVGTYIGDYISIVSESNRITAVTDLGTTGLITVDYLITHGGRYPGHIEIK